MRARTAILCLTIVLVATGLAFATANYEYGPDEYDTISSGISPDGKFALTAHGGGEYGYDDFHLYLTDAKTGKNIDSLEEVVEVLDTKATAFAARWSSDSRQVTIVYRVDRHAPLKAVLYSIRDRRARCLKGPFDVKREELTRYWQSQSSHAPPSPKIFGTPVHRDEPNA
jgi:hypothetical protein